MARFTRQQFFEIIICRNLGGNRNISCDGIHNNDPDFTKITDKMEDLLSYLQLFETLLPLLIVCIVGPLSDIYGRKWFMLVNLVGCIFLPLGYLCIDLLNHVPTWFLLLPSIPPAITGFDAGLTNNVYSYAGDASHGKSPRSASIRFIIIDTLNCLFAPAGLYGGSYVLRIWGFGWLFGITAGFALISALYIAFFISNIIPTKVIDATNADNEKNKSCGIRIIEFTKVLFSCVLEKRAGYGRAVINLLLLILGINAITYTCDNNVTFIFLQEKFGFDQTAFANIQSVRMLLTGVGSLLLVGFINLTSLNVLILGVIGTISRLAYYLEYALADHTWVLYFGNALGAIGGTVPAACKIIIASIAEPSQLGKLNTFVALLESLIPLAFVPVFDQVWKMTSSKFPGLNFLITSGVLVIILCMFLIISALRLLGKSTKIKQETR